MFTPDWQIKKGRVPEVGSLLLQIKFGVPNFNEEEFFSVRTNIITYVPAHEVLEDGNRNLSWNIL